MIPILYAASETDFTTNGIGLLTDAVSCTVTEERNGALATATDGSVKRMAITYDVINDEGKVISSNAKLNRVVIDQSALKAIDTLEQLAQESIKTALSDNAEN